MPMSSDPYATRYTLIQRARDLDDEEAWNTLWTHYQNFIMSIARRMGVREYDLDDVQSVTMVTLMKSIQNFDPEKGKFRHWFSRIITVSALRHFRSLKRHEKISDKVQQYHTYIDSYSAPEVEQQIQGEWNRYLTELALERVKELHRGHAYEVLRMDLAGASVEEIHHALQIEVNTVYTLRKRIKRTLKRELSHLETELEL